MRKVVELYGCEFQKAGLIALLTLLAMFGGFLIWPSTLSAHKSNSAPPFGFSGANLTGVASQGLPALLCPGDLIVVDQSALAGNHGAVIRVDPNTGMQTLLAAVPPTSGETGSDPIGIAFAPDGRLFITQPQAQAILRIDPVTNSITTVTSQGFLDIPFGIAVDTAGQIYVSDVNAFGGTGGIIKVDPVTGAQTVLSSYGYFREPGLIAIDGAGQIIVPDYNPGAEYGRVFSVNPETGVQSVIAEGNFMRAPAGVAIDAAGNILVADVVAHAVIRIDSVTRQQSLLSSGGHLQIPIGIAVDAAGYVWVVDEKEYLGTGEVIRIDPVSGAQAVVSTGDLLVDPIGLAVVHGSHKVTIDVKPNSFPNSINPRSNGVIPVAILTTEAFDATRVDPDTVRFGATGTEARAVQAAIEDVNGDGYADMILHFRTQETGIACGQTEAVLTGEMAGHGPIRGTDSIRTAGCE